MANPSSYRRTNPWSERGSGGEGMMILQVDLLLMKHCVFTNNSAGIFIQNCSMNFSSRSGGLTPLFGYWIKILSILQTDFGTPKSPQHKTKKKSWRHQFQLHLTFASVGKTNLTHGRGSKPTKPKKKTVGVGTLWVALRLPISAYLS